MFAGNPFEVKLTQRQPKFHSTRGEELDGASWGGERGERSQKAKVCREGQSGK